MRAGMRGLRSIADQIGDGQLSSAGRTGVERWSGPDRSLELGRNLPEDPLEPAAELLQITLERKALGPIDFLVELYDPGSQQVSKRLGILGAEFHVHVAPPCGERALQAMHPWR